MPRARLTFDTWFSREACFASLFWLLTFSLPSVERTSYSTARISHKFSLLTPISGGWGRGRSARDAGRDEERSLSLSPSLLPLSLSLYDDDDDDPPLGAPRTRLPPPDLLASFFSIRPRRSSASFAPSRRPPRTARSCRLASSIASTERRSAPLHFGTTESPFALVSRENNSGSSKKIEGAEEVAGGEQDMAPAKGKGKKRVRDQAAVEVVDLDDDDDGLDSVKEGSGELNREREAKEYAMHIKGICEEANAAIAAARGADLVSEEVRALSLQTLARKSPAPGLRPHPSRLEHRLTLALSCSCSSPPGRCALRRSSRSSWGTSCGTSCSTSVSRTANRSQGKRSRLW